MVTLVVLYQIKFFLTLNSDCIKYVFVLFVCVCMRERDHMI